MNGYNFFNPTHITFGAGTLNITIDVIPGNCKKKIMLVTGKTSMRKHGFTDRIIALLKHHEVLVYDKVKPNPDIQIAEDGVKLARQGHIDTVIGLGGGSSIDIGKTIAFAAVQEYSVKELLESTVSPVNKSMFFIAIPTTAGSGSEVTKWATIWDHNRKQKLSLEHQNMFPNHAIIDPLLHVSMPTDLTAITGLDSLCHAVEAYWSKNAQPISDMFAIKAIEILNNNVVKAYKNPGDLMTRKAMAQGSLLAGLAFSNTKTTACHSISYPMTAHYNIPHGLACALTLPSIIEFNYSEPTGKALKLMRIFGVDTIQEWANKIRELMKELQLPTNLSELKLKNKDIEIIVEDGFHQDRINHNPKEITKTDLKNILEKMVII